MIISDLDYLESLSNDTAISGSGSAEVAIAVFSQAIGRYAKAWTQTKTISTALPNGGALAIGVGVSVGVAYTPPSL